MWLVVRLRESRVRTGALRAPNRCANGQVSRIDGNRDTSERSYWSLLCTYKYATSSALTEIWSISYSTTTSSSQNCEWQLDPSSRRYGQRNAKWRWDFAYKSFLAQTTPLNRTVNAHQTAWVFVSQSSLALPSVRSGSSGVFVVNEWIGPLRTTVVA